MSELLLNWFREIEHRKRMNLVYVMNELMEKGKLLKRRREAHMQVSEIYEQ